MDLWISLYHSSLHNRWLNLQKNIPKTFSMMTALLRDLTKQLLFAIKTLSEENLGFSTSSFMSNEQMKE